MILDYKRIDLFGKMLFEKAIIGPPFKKPNPMPNEACFLYIIEGEYNSISETEILRIKAHESVLMKCGNYLSQMYASLNSDRYQAIAVHFFPDILEKVYEQKVPKFLTKTVQRQKADMGKINSDIVIRKYIDSILFYFENPALVNEDILILKLQEIILLLNETKNAPVIQAILSNLFEPNSYDFRQTIEAHLYSPVSTKELAQLTNKSLSSFKREFKRIYQATPATYIRDQKLKKAAELLISSEQRLSAIAYKCGFSDIAHFSKTFKQKFGSAPSSYRLTHIDKSMDDL